MKRAVLLLLVLVIPSVALAQPGPDLPSAGPPAPPPAEPAEPPPPPQQPGLAPPALQPPTPPPQGPAYAMAPQLSLHSGFTFEANVGGGWVHESASFGGASQSIETDGDLAGLDLGIGGWLSPNLALTARVAGVQVTNTNTNGRAGHYFVGPSLQLWIDNHFWLGAGAGVSVLFQISGANSTGPSSYTGLGVDMRAGYTLTADSQSSFNLSVELNPGFYNIDSGLGSSLSLTLTGIAFLAGYQFL